MAVWRRKALEAFPQLRSDLQRRDYTIYRLFLDLRHLSQSAYQTDDHQSLSRIYTFAEWCLRQPALENAAAVGFFEHIFDDHPFKTELLKYLSPYVIQTCSPLWVWRLADKYSPEALQKLFTR